MRHINKASRYRVLIIFVLFLLSSTDLFAQEKFIQINLGYNFQKFVDFGFNAELERKLPKLELFTINFGMAYVKYPPGGVSINGTQVATIKQEITNYFIKAKWYPFTLKNRSFSLLYVAAGPMYAVHKFNKTTGYQGLGLTFSAGFNYLLFNRFLFGLQWEYGLYHSSNYEGLRTTDYNLNFRIGYRFTNK